MKFNLTPNWKELERETEYLCNWHEWFAWFPIWVNWKIIWLEKVKRKKLLGHDEHGNKRPKWDLYLYEEIKRSM